MVSIASFKSSSIQHEVHLAKYGFTRHKIDDKAWQGYLVVDNWLQRRVPVDALDILPAPNATCLVQIWPPLAPKTKLVTAIIKPGV